MFLGWNMFIYEDRIWIITIIFMSITLPILHWIWKCVLICANFTIYLKTHIAEVVDIAIMQACAVYMCNLLLCLHKHTICANFTIYLKTRIAEVVDIAIMQVCAMYMCNLLLCLHKPTMCTVLSHYMYKIIELEDK